MKKFLIFTICVFMLLFTIPSPAANIHTVRPEGVTPFVISNEFPGSPENGSFRYQPYAAGKIKDLSFVLVIGVSASDPDYMMMILFGQVDGTVHVIAVSTGQVRDVKGVNVKYYKDASFFETGKFSGVLTKTDRFPGPEDLERVAPAKKISI